MAFDPNKLTNAQQQKIFKVLDWIEEHGGEQGAKSQFTTKLRQLGKELGLDDSETKDLEALIDRRLGESRLIKAAAQHLTEEARGQLNESTLSQFITSTVRTAADFDVNDVLRVASSLTVHCARRMRDNGEGQLGDKVQQLALVLDRIADSY
jgi:hypothetical protein